MAKVTIYTQVYNAGEYLRPCIDSVLAQTHTDWEHIVADAGSTDGSVEILKEYAKDERVKFVQLPKNRWSQYEMTEKYATGEYYTSLDHDDWWEPEFLESLLDFSQKNDLDLAVTGVLEYQEETKKEEILRKLGKPAVLSIEEFAKNYRRYGTFVNARWAHIMRTEQYLSMKDEYFEAVQSGLVWRSDTVLMLKYMAHFHRIGIDNTLLQHYRRHNRSQISFLDKKRLDSEASYYNAVRTFLENFNAWNSENQGWISKAMIFDINNALIILDRSPVSEEEKLRECGRYLSHPVTLEAMENKETSAEKSSLIKTVLGIIIEAISRGDISEKVTNELRSSLEKFAPDCAAVMQPAYLSALAQGPDLLDALLRNDPKRMRTLLLDRIESGTFKEKIVLGDMLRELIPAVSPLRGAQNADVFSAYPQICRFILDGANLTALDLMTGELMDAGESGIGYDFINVYLNLAAQMGQVPAFLFGKIRLAYRYLQDGKIDMCWQILDELKEMGAGQNTEVVQLENQLRTFTEETTV